jgi:hypothetical protein
MAGTNESGQAKKVRAMLVLKDDESSESSQIIMTGCIENNKLIFTKSANTNEKTSEEDMEIARMFLSGQTLPSSQTEDEDVEDEEEMEEDEEDEEMDDEDDEDEDEEPTEEDLKFVVEDEEGEEDDEEYIPEDDDEEEEEEDEDEEDEDDNDEDEDEDDDEDEDEEGDEDEEEEEGEPKETVPVTKNERLRKELRDLQENMQGWESWKANQLPQGQALDRRTRSQRTRRDPSNDFLVQLLNDPEYKSVKNDYFEGNDEDDEEDEEDEEGEVDDEDEEDDDDDDDDDEGEEMEEDDEEGETMEDDEDVEEDDEEGEDLVDWLNTEGH